MIVLVFVQALKQHTFRELEETQTTVSSGFLWSLGASADGGQCVSMASEWGYSLGENTSNLALEPFGINIRLHPGWTEGPKRRLP